MNQEGKELITDIFKSKSFFGFTSFLSNEPYTENAVAIRRTRLLKIKKQELVQLLKTNPQLGLNFMDLLYNDLEHVKDQLMHLAYDSVRKKTADAILQLSGSSEPDKVIQISRSDLASMIGIAKETLTRTLTDFREEKLIKTKRNIIEILDARKLGQIK